MSRLLLLPLLVLLALPSAAFADEAPATNPNSLMVWGPRSDTDRTQEAQDLIAPVLREEELPPERNLKLREWLGEAKFRIGGSAESVACVTAPPSIVDAPPGVEGEIPGTVAAGRKALDDLDHAMAVDLLRTAQGRIACQKETFVPTEAFWEAFFYGGIAAYYAGAEGEADRMFRQAAAVDATKPWDEAYPPEPQSAYLSAVQDIVARPTAKVYGDMRGTNYREVWLDGKQLDLTKSFETEVRPGMHLVQAVDDNGQWATFVRDLKEGRTLELFSAQGLATAVLEGPDGVLANVAAANLSRRAGKQSLEDIYIVVFRQGLGPRVIRYSVGEGTWITLERRADGTLTSTRTRAELEGEDLTPGERNKRAMLRDPDYRSAVAIGFKVSQLFRCAEDETDGAGRCNDTGGERTSLFLGGLVNIDVNLIKGLNLDIRLGAHVSDWDQGGVILPEVAFGLKYRFLTGVMQPWIGVDADVFFGTTRENPFADDQVTVYAGVLPLWGLDFEFPDGFRLGFEGGYAVIIGGEGKVVNYQMPHFQFMIGRFIP